MIQSLSPTESLPLNVRPALEVALTAAYEGGSIAEGWFRSGGYAVRSKENLSPVTIADEQSEERIIQIIRSSFPDHMIIAEESGVSLHNTEARWFIDPIDGTKSFIHGVPLWGTMIGFELEGRMEVGVVYLPLLQQMYYGVRNAGAYCNGRRISVSTTSSLSKAVILTTDERKILSSEKLKDGYLSLSRVTKFQRSWGDCYGHMLVASGRAECMIDPAMAVWDNAPLNVIITEAGGVITTIDGRRDILGDSSISTNKILGDEIRSILTNH